MRLHSDEVVSTVGPYKPDFEHTMLSVNNFYSSGWSHLWFHSRQNSVTLVQIQLRESAAVSIYMSSFPSLVRCTRRHGISVMSVAQASGSKTDICPRPRILYPDLLLTLPHPISSAQTFAPSKLDCPTQLIPRHPLPLRTNTTRLPKHPPSSKRRTLPTSSPTPS